MAIRPYRLMLEVGLVNREVWVVHVVIKCTQKSPSGIQTRRIKL